MQITDRRHAGEMLSQACKEFGEAVGRLDFVEAERLVALTLTLREYLCDLHRRADGGMGGIGGVV